MKFALPLFAALLLSLFGTGCASYHVYSETEPGVNFYKYRTYNWLNTKYVQRGNGGPEWLNERVENKIRSAVESHMNRFGFKPCEEQPDLMLHFHVVIRNEVFYFHDWWCDEDNGTNLGRCHRLRPVNYQEGTLLIDIIDGKTGQQVWRGAASNVVEYLTPEQTDARVEEAIRLIFEKFPGKGA